MNTTSSHEKGLVRGLGLGSAFSAIAGTVIGSAVFLVACDIAQVLPSPLMALAVWIAAGIVSIVGCLIFAELGTRYPQAGGHYIYLKEAFHPLVGFLCGWTLVLIIQTGSIAGVAVAFSRFGSKFIDMTPFAMKTVSSLLVIALTWLNCRGIRESARWLDGITALKIVAILGVAAIGLAHRGQATAAFDWSYHGEWKWSALGVAFIAAFWAYDGWTSLSFIAGEIHHPQRNIPRASILGIACVGVLYVLCNLCYFFVMPGLASITGSSFVAADAAQIIAGPVGVKILTLLVLISALGCVNAMILSSARVIYAMALDGFLPRVFARLHPTKRSPDLALLAQLAWTLVLIWSGSYDQLFTYVMFAAFLFYVLTTAALFRLRRVRPDDAPAYQVAGYPWLPALYLLFMGALTVNTIVEKPTEALVGLLLIALGAPAYFYFKRVETRRGLASGTVGAALGAAAESG